MSVSDAQRLRLATYAQFLVSKARLIHYAEVRPMMSNVWRRWDDVVNHLTGGGALTMDCSESVTSLFRWAGLRDPNGLGYDGQGYTGTLLEHLPHYANTRHAHIGALGVFGSFPGTHVVMVTRRGGDDPYVFSHGSENGPYNLPLSMERAAHRGESLTWLNIGDL